MTSLRRRRPLSRRSILRGILGGAAVSIVLPPLEAMFDANGTAHADGTPVPKRLGIFFFGNGVKRDRFFPPETGPGFTLPDELAPFAPVRDYLSVVSGMSINPRGR